MLVFQPLFPQEGFDGARDIFDEPGGWRVPPQQADIKVGGQDGIVLVARDENDAVRIEIHWGDGYHSAYTTDHLLVWGLLPEMTPEQLDHMGFRVRS